MQKVTVDAKDFELFLKDIVRGYEKHFDTSEDPFEIRKVVKVI